MDNSKRRAGFTLVEMLVVVAVIMVLMGVLLSAVQVAVTKARKAETLVTAQSLATALEGYNDEYPAMGFRAVAAMGGLGSEAIGRGYIIEPLFRLLTGEDVGGLNPRRVRFLETGGKRMRVGPDTVTSVRGLLDPWGRLFFFSIDLEDDGMVTVREGGATRDIDASQRRVAVWSSGKDRRDDSPKYTRDNIRTWRADP